MEKETFTIDEKYFFTSEEKKQLSDDLANKNLKIREVEDHKKARMSMFKEQIDDIKHEIHKISNNLVMGYEYREFKCVREIDFDRKVRVFKDVMTGNVIRETPLQPEDLQHKMQFAK